MPLPRFRTLDVIPVEEEGKPVFLVRDNEGLFEHTLRLPPMAFVVATLLDGVRDLKGIREAIAAQFNGTDLPEKDLEGIVADLDANLLLESEKVFRRRQEISSAFTDAPTRPARFAGISYSKEPEELKRELSAFYDAAGGAGQPGTGSESSEVSAIIAPHIDFPRGGVCYTHPYRQVSERSRADVYVILGVAHVSPPNPFVLCSKGYETPLGTAEADSELIEAIRKRVPGCFEDEQVHLNEHSAEFQAVFLKYARPAADFKIVPILCSSFEPHCGSNLPETVPRIGEFLQALGESIRESGKKVCLVGGVDFAHIGPRFGDQVELNQKRIDWMVEEDRKSIDMIVDGNAEGFWHSVMADGNRRNVCGVSATWSLLRMLEGKKGAKLDYGYAADPAGGYVSYAGLVF